MLTKHSIHIEPQRQLIKGRPDLTPIVDVLFLLLIFFMLSSSFVQVSGVSVELPELSTGQSKGIKKFIVTIDHNGRLWFNDQPHTIATLREELQRVTSDTVVVRADKSVAFEHVAQLMSLTEEAGLDAFIAINDSTKSSPGTTFDYAEESE